MGRVRCAIPTHGMYKTNLQRKMALRAATLLKQKLDKMASKDIKKHGFVTDMTRYWAQADLGVDADFISGYDQGEMPTQNEI